MKDDWMVFKDLPMDEVISHEDIISTKNIWDERIELAVKAAEKEIDDMTDDEKCAIAMVAGCRLVSEMTEDGKLIMRTENPVSFAKINGKIQVYEFKQSYGTLREYKED